MFNCSISLASLNVRGLKDLVKRKALFLFCKGRKPHCLLLQETHSSEVDTKFWANQWVIEYYLVMGPISPLVLQFVLIGFQVT